MIDQRLKAFLSVCEFKSFSKAAVALGTTQTRLSRLVRSLEEELGAELLYRDGRGVQLNDIGGVVLERAKAVVGGYEAMAEEVRAFINDVGGRVVIGMPPAAAAILGTALLQRFHEKYPNVRIVLEVGYSGFVHQWLSSGNIDVALLYNARPSSTLTVQPLLEERLYLISAGQGPGAFPGRTIEASKLVDFKYVLPSRLHGLRNLIDLDTGPELALDVVFEVDFLPPTLELVATGKYATILPYSFAHTQIVEGSVRAARIVGPEMIGHYSLATATNRPMGRATTELIRYLSRLLRDLIAEGRWVSEPSEGDDAGSKELSEAST